MHLSDLHCCPARTGWDADRLRRTLSKDLAELIERDELRPDFLFFTGDAAFGHLPDEGLSIHGQLDDAASFFEEVRQVCGLERDRVFLVPGNHDVDRTAIAEDDSAWLEERRTSYDRAAVNELMRDGDAKARWSSVMARLDAWRDFLERHGYGHLLQDHERLTYVHRLRLEGVEVAIAGLNSAWSCHGDDRGRLWMAGEYQVADLESRKEMRGADVRIALAQQDELHRLVAADVTSLQVAPSGPQLTELLLAPDPVEVLARIIASQVKLTRLSPYQTGGGVHRPAVFFGREDLRAHVLNRDPANYLVVGGRQMGKSSLLKAIERHYRDEPRVRCLYLVLSGADLVGSLARSLGLERGADLDAVVDRLAESGERTLCLIDEADTFIRKEGGESPTLARLRSLSEEGRCQFVLAGFWDLYESAVLDYQSPLRNFGETLRVGPLEVDACRALATRPMATLGLSYGSDDLVERIVTHAGQRANLVAIVCNEVLKHLGTRDRVISTDAVQAALDSPAVDEALDGWRDLGRGDEEASRLDRVLVYSMVERGGFTLEEASRRLVEVGLMAPGEWLRRSLQRLELAYVLRREGRRYVFPVPLFVERLQEQDPAVLLENELA